MKRSIITLAVIVFIIRSSFACCGPQNHTISEVMLKPNNIGFILIKIDSSYQINDSQYFESYSLISKATVLSSFKNHPKTNKIIVRSGSLNSSAGSKKLVEGHMYFLVSGSDDGINYSGFVCDPFSYEIKKEDSIIHFGVLSGTKNLFKMVKSYYDLVKNKFTGRFILGENGRYYAEGNMINGELDGEVLHYLTKKSKVMDRDEPLVKSRHFYKNGKLDGLCENYFNFYGEIDYRKYWYEKGELVKSEFYTEDDGYFKLSSKTEYK